MLTRKYNANEYGEWLRSSSSRHVCEFGDQGDFEDSDDDADHDDCDVSPSVLLGSADVATLSQREARGQLDLFAPAPDGAAFSH
jgi:hypothetical protein